MRNENGSVQRIARYRARALTVLAVELLSILARLNEVVGII